MAPSKDVHSNFEQIKYKVVKGMIAGTQDYGSRCCPEHITF